MSIYAAGMADKRYEMSEYLIKIESTANAKNSFV